MVMGIDLMDQQQRAAVEEDPELKEECRDYGNWYQHLYNHLKSEEESDA